MTTDPADVYAVPDDQQLDTDTGDDAVADPDHDDDLTDVYADPGPVVDHDLVDPEDRP